jgi:hypothetical protein
MRKISEIKGEDALDVLADLLDPVSEICVDEKVKELFKKRKKLNLAAYILKEHKKSILTILALLEGVKPDEYKPSLAVLPVLVLQLLNDPDVIAVFQSAGLETFSGSATENTQEAAKE